MTLGPSWSNTGPRQRHSWELSNRAPAFGQPSNNDTRRFDVDQSRIRARDWSGAIARFFALLTLNQGENYVRSTYLVGGDLAQYWPAMESTYRTASIQPRGPNYSGFVYSQNHCR